MKINKKINLSEDNEFDTIEVSDEPVDVRGMSNEEILVWAENRGWNLDDIYNEIGDSLFDEYGFLLDRFDYYELYDEFGDILPERGPYFKNRVLKDFREKFDGEVVYDMDSNEIYQPSGGNVSLRFCQACFDRDAWEYFDTTDIGGVEGLIRFYYKRLTDENKKALEKFGFNGDITESAIQELSNYADIYHVFDMAVTDGLRSGMEQDAYKRFDEAFMMALPKGVTFNPDEANYEDVKRRLRINEEFILNNYMDIWYAYGDWSNSLRDNIIHAAISLFNDEFEFYSPRYGFDGFDEEAFNDYMSDIGISELEDAVEHSV